MNLRLGTDWPSLLERLLLRGGESTLPPKELALGVALWSNPPRTGRQAVIAVSRCQIKQLGPAAVVCEVRFESGGRDERRAVDPERGGPSARSEG